jgi:hypothetical protein
VGKDASSPLVRENYRAQELKAVHVWVFLGPAYCAGERAI